MTKRSSQMDSGSGVSLGARLIVAAPYLWLLGFFLVPFLIVLKISLSESAIAQPPYLPVLDLTAGLRGLRDFVSGLSFTNYFTIAGDDLYLFSYLKRLEAAASQFARCAAKVHVVHNALDLEAFDPSQVRGRLRAELGIGPDVVVVGSHGRVLRRKGYVEFVRAGRLALDRMDGAERSRVAFVVVGDTPQDFRPDHVEECKALAGELGLLGRFHMLGFRPDVRPFVADFDLAVVPSVYADPLPRAVIESMALAKPVVAFDVGGVSEMIEHGITGELVPFEPGRDGEGASAVAVERLAAALARHVRDPALRARQGAAGRRRVEREFDARVHARLIQREIVASSAPRGGRRR